MGRYADDVDVGLDRLARRLFRRLEQRAVIDVEADIGKGGSDDLSAAVVAVLAQFGDQHARPPSLVAGKPCDLALHPAKTFVVLVLAAIDARDRADLGAVAGEHRFERVGDLADRGPRPHSLDRQFQEVAFAAFRRRGQRCECNAAALRVGWCRSRSRRSSCAVRTAPLSTSRSSTDAASLDWYLLTPTMVSSPRSIRAWRRAAASSMRSLGIPASTALVMPPIASTSSISAIAAAPIEWVSLST